MQIGRSITAGAGILALSLVAAACGEASGGSASGECETPEVPTLTLAAYSTPREVYGKIIPAFQEKWKAEHDDQQIIFQESYGGSTIRLTLVTAVITGVVNALFGTLLAYVLLRYRFAGKTILSTVVDLPLAIPTLVTGVMLSALYGPASPFGSLLGRFGVQVIFAVPGIILALLFITLPFVIRTVQPVLLELDVGEEEASYLLGAGSWTTFRRVTLPALLPAIVAGAMLTFARALGEFGSIVIVSGNLPATRTAPVYIFQLSSQFRYEEAAVVATALFAISFVTILITDRILKRGKEAL